ncbi:MAG TPA: nuclear transport factor 2 family protein [Steroidobacteraceae bacterium]|nr:nuclear transport factor 2 family protein [Steroidobacteraceae bacterium]
MQDGDLPARIARLEACEAIRQLVGRYGVVIDNRDIEGIGLCFTRQGSFRSRDGVMNARGREAVVAQFHGRFAVLGPSMHWTHDHLIWPDAADPDRARGLVSSHVELVRHDRPMVCALRYEDAYRREDGEWRFEDRLLSFFYYVEVQDYARSLGSLLRMRAYEKPAPADYPEALQSWRDYYSQTTR